MKNNIHTCLLIDPYTQTVNPIDIVREDIHAIQDAIGCDCFCVGGYLANGDVVYVDDEGLINGTTHGFRIASINGGQPLMGRGLVVGTAEEGASASAESTAEGIYNVVHWRFSITKDNGSAFEFKARRDWEKNERGVEV